MKRFLSIVLLVLVPSVVKAEWGESLGHTGVKGTYSYMGTELGTCVFDGTSIFLSGGGSVAWWDSSVALTFNFPGFNASQFNAWKSNPAFAGRLGDLAKVVHDGVTDQDGDGDVDVLDAIEQAEPGPELDELVEDDPYWDAHPEEFDEALDNWQDINGNGEVDAYELWNAKDWDGDGLFGFQQNEATGNWSQKDSDSDNDGEPDGVEWNVPDRADSGRPAQYDGSDYPDRDGDLRPDWKDDDGDGWSNILENLAGANGKRIGDPNNANKGLVPNGGTVEDGNRGPLLVDQRSGREGNNLGTNPHDWTDSDGDGAPNWVEDYYAQSQHPAGTTGTVPDGSKYDHTKFPDSNGDHVWDFGGGWTTLQSSGAPQLDATVPQWTADPPAIVIQSTPTTPGGSSGAVQFPAIPPTPGSSAGAGTTPLPNVNTPPAIQPSRQTIQMPSNITPFSQRLTNTNQGGYFNPAASGSQSSNAGYGGGLVGGSSPVSPGGGGGGGSGGSGSGGGGSGGGSGGSGGGTGEGEGDGEGTGNFREVIVPRGTSKNWMGAAGGTWQQTAGPNHGDQMGGFMEGLRAELANSFPNGLQAYGSSNFVLTFDIPKPTGGFWHFEVPTLPDTTTAVGQIAEVVRTFLRLFFAVVVGWVFISNVMRVLCQW